MVFQNSPTMAPATAKEIQPKPEEYSGTVSCKKEPRFPRETFAVSRPLIKAITKVKAIVQTYTH